MYELKTLLPQFDIKLPTCMYELRNVGLAADAVPGACNEISSVSESNATSVSVSDSSTGTACALDLDTLGVQIQQILKSSGETAEAVAQRQERVLQQLNELKEQLAGIRSTLGLSQKKDTTTTTSSSAQLVNGNAGQEEPLHDIVINGHPHFIPYGLLAIRNAWKNLLNIDVRTFTHSSLNDIGPEARAFEEALKALPADTTKPKIKVTLIWKNCEHTAMICSPTMYVPIYGEVNILRYLGRIGPSEYRYEESPLCNEIDVVLDICYQLLRCPTAKSRSGLIRALNNRLQKRRYFGGDTLSIADIGVHSSLKRLPSAADKELTPQLNEWRKRVQMITLI